MSIIIAQKQFTPAPEDLHAAVCVDAVDLGVKATKFGPKEKVRLVWELDPTTAGLLDNSRRFIIQKMYTKSLHEKATLHKDLKAWRGRAFTAEELSAFDLETVIGAPCKILVTHRENEGIIYADVAAIMKADKGTKLLPTGEYIRVKDRPENGSSHADFHVPDGEDAEPVPF